MLFRSLQIAGLPVELSQTNMAMSDKRAHAEFF
jgi:hypothetical protein